MQIETTQRRVTTRDGLTRLLEDIEAGRREKPDWIQLQGGARIDEIPAGKRKGLLDRLHANVLRGFRSTIPDLRPKARLSLWRTIAASGFHDFAEEGSWTKRYDSPFQENYDYVGDYLERGIAGLDPYRLYSAVLGTHDYTVEDFVATELCRNVRTVIEPMAGSAEFSYHSHFRNPDFRYLMFDLDEDACRHVQERRWLADTEHHYLIADVLDEEIWKRTKSLTTGESLCYIGKQSHHFFGARDLLRLMRLATDHVDYFMLEVPPPTLVTDLPETDELTRNEMEDAGFHVALIDEPDQRPNPITHHMGFRLEAWDRRERRTLFHYRGWTNWQLPMLVSLADLLGLRATYLHSEEHELVSVHDGTDTADILDNVSFLVLTRHRELAGEPQRDTDEG